MVGPFVHHLGATMPGETARHPDFDGAWKEALQNWLPECLALFWPGIHQLVDWTAPPVFLNQELQQLSRKLKQRGTQRVDLLAQLQLDSDGDDDTATFRHGGFGDELIFRFPIVNVAQWQHRVAELESLAPRNPFAIVLLAQLKCRATVPDTTRLASKLQLTRLLLKWNYDAAVRVVLLEIMDALLTLPDTLDDRFVETLEQIEEPAMMQRLNSVERVMLRREKAASMEEGLQKGLQKGLQVGKLEGTALLLQTLLQRKFGSVPEWAAVRITEAGTETLQQWALNVLEADTLEKVFELT